MCYYFFLSFIADVCLESGKLRHGNLLFYSGSVHWLFDIPIKKILNVVIDSPNSAIKLFENLRNFKGWKIDGQKTSKFYLSNAKLNWGMSISPISKKILPITDSCTLVKTFTGNNFKILNSLNFIDAARMFFNLQKCIDKTLVIKAVSTGVSKSWASANHCQQVCLIGGFL